jgi:hypothetical protein
MSKGESFSVHSPPSQLREHFREQYEHYEQLSQAREGRCDECGRLLGADERECCVNDAGLPVCIECAGEA